MKIDRGDVAIITGASKGLGTYIANALAAKGVNLVLAARSAELLANVAYGLRSFGVEVLIVPTDVSVPTALESLVESAIRRFGRIDILVNNAGFDYSLRFDRCRVEDIGKTIAINLTGPIILTRLVIARMLEGRRGHIVNIASVAGVLPPPYEESYVASKHGLVGFTRSLRASAQDMKWPISASVVCPGFVDDGGMYERMKQAGGAKVLQVWGSVTATTLAASVVRAIEEDRPDILGVSRWALVMLVWAPRLFEFMTSKMNNASAFRAVALAHADRGKEERTR